MSDRAQNKTQNVILDSMTEWIFTIDLDLRITSFNRAVEEINNIHIKCKQIYRVGKISQRFNQLKDLPDLNVIQAVNIINYDYYFC